MKYKENWGETQQRFNTWWNHKKMGRPLMNVVAVRTEPLEALEPVIDPESPEQLCLNVESNVKRYRNFCRTHTFMADAFPKVEPNIGPGSMSTYLGSEPVFAWDTVWYSECVEDWNKFDLKYDENNPWWKCHLEMIRKAQKMSSGDFLVTIPDIVENVDILSAMQGPQAFCYELMDHPELIRQKVGQIDDLYFKYYDAFYDIVKAADGSSSYTYFSIWGPGKTAKIQCDFCAMMSPGQFREFAKPSLEKQCRLLTNSLYHLDGPDAIRHLDALMEIKELDALQWTAGAGQPDGGDEKWFPIYDKVRAAGKSLWIYICDGEAEEWIRNADRVVKTFGSDGLYLHFPIMNQENANKLMIKAEDCWG